MGEFGCRSTVFPVASSPPSSSHLVSEEATLPTTTLLLGTTSVPTLRGGGQKRCEPSSPLPHADFMDMKFFHDTGPFIVSFLSRNCCTICFYKDILQRFEKMDGCKKPPRSAQPSINYRWNPIEGAAFELTDFVHEEYAPTLTNQQSSKKSEPKAHELLSTTELISAVGQIWNCMNRLPVFQSKANHNNSGCQKEDILGNLGREENGGVPSSVDSKYFCVDLRGASHFSTMVQPKLEFLKVFQKMSMYEHFSENYTHSLVWMFLQGRNNLPNQSRKEKGLTSSGIQYKLRNIYGWMNEIIPTGLKSPLKTNEIGNTKNGEFSIPGDTSSPVGTCILGDTYSPTDNLTIGSADGYPDLIECKYPSSSDNAKLVMNSRATTRYSDYLLRPVQDIKADGTVSRTVSSSLHADDHTNSFASCSSASEECQHKEKHDGKFVSDDKTSLKIDSSAPERPHYALAKQEHAFAGAFAGIFVSLCLHPVDTIKTVIQSCHARQKSICYIGSSIVSERGLSGLYRGITSNIASSAPISAVYTFTYESVKGALLPLFPKEYHSFAHCIAGGSASIATSFIFTPSERVKQQMQVGSHYNNCWNALAGIIGKGGLPSLYAGWGAVLCRNIPHSIIKFYTYESLKQLMLSSTNSRDRPNTAQTLVCGGVAGSTAALFTTPFDVVKTRLQTQIPGSMSQYNSVFHALQEIGKQEGLKGLYRGLVPRLFMYMSQGAIFFASYEFFKSSFSMEVSQLNAQSIQYRQNTEDDSMPLQSTIK